MTSATGWRIRPAAAIAIALVLLLAGSAITYVFTRDRTRGAGTATAPLDSHVDRRSVDAAPAAPRFESESSKLDPLPDVIVPLADDAIARAGIVAAAVARSAGTSEIRLPGVIEPNGYRQVTVTPLVSGRITEVSAQLGEHVRREQPLARLYSPELAEAQTKYVSAWAMLQAHDRELERTEKLVEIGAASQQELERTHAEHTAQRADLETARSRLLLLGVPTASIDSMGPGKEVSPAASVFAPIDGVVTERLANVGLNVDPATKLFTIVDLRTVWIVADVYEKDLSRVATGSAATVVTTAFPEHPVQGRVSYIDPQVAATTRTAKVRVEVPNPQGELRLGMYATVLLRTDSPGTVLTIPQGAVQQVGDRQVVYLRSKDSGKFIEREVHASPSSRDRVEVTSGLHEGDVVVTEGSFFVRAERERLGLRPAATDAGARHPAAPDTVQRSDKSVPQSAHVSVEELGFEPSTVKLRAGVPARLTFVRSTDKTCAKEVVIPSMKIRRALPLNEPVEIEFMPQKGEIGFVCGMNMLRGTIVVE